MKKLLCVLTVVLLLCGCQSKGDVIKTKYFQVTVPHSWEELYLYEIYEVDNNVYSLIFYDKDSNVRDFGGHIVTFSIYYNKDEFDYLPSYNYLGKISNGNNSYYIVTELPTDVQFDTSTEDSYKKLADSYESVINSIEYINGYQLVKE